MASAHTMFSVMQAMADALPTNRAGDDSSDLANSYEVIALLIHAYLATLNFRLCSYQEEPISNWECLTPRLPLKCNSDCGSISFVHEHEQSSMRFAFHIDRIGTNVEVRASAGISDENICLFLRRVYNVVDSNALPIRISVRRGREDRSDLVEKLRQVFISEDAISDILRDLNVNFIQKLIPDLEREMHVENAEAGETAGIECETPENPQQPYNPSPAPRDPWNPPGHLPKVADPRSPRVPADEIPPPSFEDEYEIMRPPPGGPAAIPGGRHSHNIGQDDLNPPSLKTHDPLRGSSTPRAKAHAEAPSGMHPTFDSSLFTTQREGSVGNYEIYDPQVPPGARWDHIGPGGTPRSSRPGRGGRGNGWLGQSASGNLEGSFGGGQNHLEST